MTNHAPSFGVTVTLSEWGRACFGHLAPAVYQPDSPCRWTGMLLRVSHFSACHGGGRRKRRWGKLAPSHQRVGVGLRLTVGPAALEGKRQGYSVGGVWLVIPVQVAHLH